MAIVWWSISVLLVMAALAPLLRGRAPAPPTDTPAPVVASPPPPASDLAPAAPAPQAETMGPLPLFRDWVAFGSGCRARSDAPGDVTMERVAVPASSGEVYRARFHLDRFRLTTDGRAANQPVNFARECAVRVQLGPPPGKRIRRVTAQTAVLSTKRENVKLTVFGELKLGAAVLGTRVLVHEASAAFGGREDVFQLAPGLTPEETFPSLSCGEGKLVGFDYTWIVERTAAGGEAFVELSGDRVLDLDAELTDC